MARWDWDTQWAPVAEEAARDLAEEIYGLAELKWLEDRHAIAQFTGGSWNQTMEGRRKHRIHVLGLHIQSVRRNHGVTRKAGRLCGWVEAWPAGLMPSLFELTEKHYLGGDHA